MQPAITESPCLFLSEGVRRPERFESPQGLIENFSGGCHGETKVPAGTGPKPLFGTGDDTDPGLFEDLLCQRFHLCLRKVDFGEEQEGSFGNRAVDTLQGGQSFGGRWNDLP